MCVKHLKIFYFISYSSHPERGNVFLDEKTGSEWLNNFLKFIQLRVEIGFESV